ncbi:translation initiation factor IF-3 [endosymbiont of Sipalinus gigas]|uniref:translation initiation factor IF-3 n=1 Tax=endosymbiont of Sipalinus gigas TaxID=1972134 RepID=UPI000DC73268|nr:translation initiation factor IF-3 [endosymbiont of Sipalinus gigas]BBA85229.1 translation initiation factor IF-3 [endosymbiont of Sipalinus gigas]
MKIKNNYNKNNLDNIYNKKIRLIYEDEKSEIIYYKDALDKANELSLDLILINSNSIPTIYKIMDYGKYIYEKKKKIKNNKIKKINVKEIKIKINIYERDYQIKLKKILDFLKKKNKVKITLKFKGREIIHKDIGIDILKRICNDSKDLSNIENFPKKIESKYISLFLIPKK